MDDGFYIYRDDELKECKVLEVRDGMMFFFGIDYPVKIEKSGVEIVFKIIMPLY